MAKVKQKVKKKATNKNGAKYKKKSSISQKVTVANNTKTTKYAYTKKITTNGTTRYYYA